MRRLFNNPKRVILVVVLFLAQAYADEKIGSSEAPAKTGEAPVINPLAKILPLGKKSEKVMYPSFDSGALKSVMTADEMERDNDERVLIKGMVMELYDLGRKPEYTITFKTAEYHLATDELSSEEETVVVADDFTLRGDRSVFDTKKEIGRFEGNVRMVITNIGSFAPIGTGGATGEKSEQ